MNLLYLSVITDAHTMHKQRHAKISAPRTHILHVLLAVQCPLQTSPITLLQICYIHTAVPCNRQHYGDNLTARLQRSMISL